MTTKDQPNEAERINRLEGQLKKIGDQGGLYRLNEQAAEVFINKKLWKIGGAFAFVFVAMQSFSVWVVSDLAASKASSEAYAKSYSQAFTNAVLSVSQAALSAEKAKLSAEEADKQLKSALKAADLVDQIAASASVEANVDEISKIIFRRIKEEKLLETAIASTFPSGSIIVNLVKPDCPPGFSSGGYVGLEIQDKGPLLQVLLADKTFYEARNIRDRDAALGGTDGVKAYACYKG